jgi:hypothetical protein
MCWRFVRFCSVGPVSCSESALCQPEKWHIHTVVSRQNDLDIMRHRGSSGPLLYRILSLSQSRCLMFFLSQEKKFCTKKILHNLKTSVAVSLNDKPGLTTTPSGSFPQHCPVLWVLPRAQPSSRVQIYTSATSPSYLVQANQKPHHRIALSS